MNKWDADDESVRMRSSRWESQMRITVDTSRLSFSTLSTVTWVGLESTLHTDTWESRISRPCGLVAKTPHRRKRVCRQTYKRPRGEHAVLTSENYRVSPCGLEAITSPGRRTRESSIGGCVVSSLSVNLRESWRENIRLLPHWTGHRAQESNQSHSHLHEGERERHTYTAATEVVSVASPLFSRDAARCCLSVAAPRVRPLGARAREIQNSLIPQQS